MNSFHFEETGSGYTDQSGLEAVIFLSFLVLALQPSTTNLAKLNYLQLASREDFKCS